MTTRQRKRSVFGKLPLPIALAALLVYFGYHLMSGDLGMRARAEIDGRREALRQELAALEAERQALAVHVARLRPEAIDPDLADERARAQLDFVHADEIIVFRDQLHSAEPRIAAR